MCQIVGKMASERNAWCPSVDMQLMAGPVSMQRFQPKLDDVAAFERFYVGILVALRDATHMINIDISGLDLLLNSNPPINCIVTHLHGLLSACASLLHLHFTAST